MFRDAPLEEHLKTASVVNAEALILAEWNLNKSENILQVGNYRYRPLAQESSKYYRIAPSFDLLDQSNSYTGATDSDVTIDGGYDDNNEPIVFTAKRQKEKMLYSLEDCLGKFRPRSGINKLRYFTDGYTHHANEDMARRPRFYMADKTDPFKYWTSYRKEEYIADNIIANSSPSESNTGVERGIANQISNQQFFIDDAAPYVVYKKPVPANRLVVKMQTGVGDISLGTFSNVNGSFSDPFFGYENQKTPVNWKVQYLDKNNNWVDAVSFNAASLRRDGSNIIGPDGYVELGYGLIIPESYRSIFNNTGIVLRSQAMLPTVPVLPPGSAYLIKSSETDKGRFAIVVESNDDLVYEYFGANYGWYLEEADAEVNSNFVTDLTSPEYYVVPGSNDKNYREFMNIYGMRIVVTTMNVFDSTFDLIEFSPRLKANISDKVVEYSVSKNASDIGVSGMPVGQLLASTGKVTIFDYDQSFLKENETSIVCDYITQNLQFKFFEIIKDVDGFDYYVPIKTMYADGLPDISSSDRTADINLRDLFFYFESMTAPQLFLQDASLSSAVSILLDYCGFSNYSFKRNVGEPELIIPYFYVAPDKSVAEVLSDLAISAQAAMFFDENNFLVVMSKNYIMPSIDDRATDITLYGSADIEKNGHEINKTTKPYLSNIVELAQQDNKVFNDGAINYTSSYIQKTYSELRQANLIDRDKTWIYKPSLLWEVSPDQRTKSINEDLAQQSDYMLSAIPLNTDLDTSVPFVVNGQIQNNVIDFGDGVYWIGRYNGYFYANGEVIKYDAVEYSVPGLSQLDAEAAGADGNSIWISNVQEYQKYFAKMPFNGKMYPTGRVRIYSEPEYETIGETTGLKDGPVSKHGRGQFGTKIVHHYSGISSEWTSSSALHGIKMENKYLFSNQLEKELSGVFNEVINRSQITFDYDYGLDVSVNILIDRMTSNNHGLKVNDIVVFYSTGQLPAELVANKVYYVKQVINENEFTVSETIGGSQVIINGTQNGSQTWQTMVSPLSFTTTISFVDVPEQTDEPALFTTAEFNGLSIGDQLFFTTTGSLPTGILPQVVYKVSSVPDEANKTFEIETVGTSIPVKYTGAGTGTHTVHTLRSPLSVSCPDHRFVAGDEVSFMFKPGDVTTGYQFPNGINSSTVLEVSSTGLSESSFMVREKSVAGVLGDRVILDDAGTGNFIAKSTMSQSQANKILVLPNTDGITVGMIVESISGTGMFQSNTKVASIDIKRNRVELDKEVLEQLIKDYIDPQTGVAVTNIIRVADRPVTTSGKAGITNGEEKTTTRTSLLKNSMSNSYLEDGEIKRVLSTQAGTVQSSALVLNGSSSALESNSPNLVSYVSKKLEDRFTHFGTRMRVIGQIEDSETRGQSAIGSSVYYTAIPKSSEQPATITGASGGIGILVDTDTNINNGYYLELVALSETNLTKYAEESIHDIVFYKIQRDATATGSSGDTANAIPVKLWGGTASITVDTGLFTEQARLQASQDAAIYDVSIEYDDKEGSYLKFYIYLNGKQVATVYDYDPLPNYKANTSVALFTRGSSRVMFDNVYALSANYAQNTRYSLGKLADGVFGDINLNSTTALQKYSLSGMIQDTYLSGISSSESPDYNIYYDEFGTIMREAAYMKVRYDKAYPALYSKIAPTFNRSKGYVVSGFVGGAYGAEFLIFNATDSALNLDSTSGNYLRILGVTLTQQSTHELTVDEYFSKISDLSDPQFAGDSLITSPVKSKQEFMDIKFSRITNGKNEFSIQTPYIQSQDAAEDMMGWMIGKVMSPRKSVGVQTFATPIIQLGDIVSFDYVNSDGIYEVANPDTRFVVYSIEYARSLEGPTQTLYLSEVK